MDRGVFTRQVLNAGELGKGRFDHGFVDIIDNTGTNGIDNSCERITKVSNNQVHHNDTDISWCLSWGGASGTMRIASVLLTESRMSVTNRLHTLELIGFHVSLERSRCLDR